MKLYSGLGVLGAVILSVSPGAFAQSAGAIRGLVYDDDFDAPLGDARVSVAETGLEAKSSGEGNYALTGLDPGTYTLIISKPGYTRQVRSQVVVRSGQLTDIDVHLSGDFAEMPEFVVQDLQLESGTEAALMELRMESLSLLDSVSADFLSQAGASDAAEGLKLVSGATVTADNFAVVRGLPDRFVSTQLNGVRMPSADPDTRAVPLDLFPSEVIESIQVSKTFTPDQQGDASGGAVNIITKSIPAQTFFRFSTKAEVNTQRPSDGEFLTDDRGGLDTFNLNPGRTVPDIFRVADPGSVMAGTNTFGKAGVSYGDAPIQYDWTLTGGLRHEFDDITLGGLATFFWNQDVKHYDNGINDDLWADRLASGSLSERLIPRTDLAVNLLTANTDDDLNTAMFDEIRSKEEVTWGGLGTFGIETEKHELGFAFLHTQVTSNTVTLAEDTRAKLLRFPGHDPLDPTSPGSDARRFAPFRRLETQDFVKRTVQSAQLNGRHTLPIFENGVEGFLEVLEPEFDWSYALSEATRSQPGLRTFDSRYLPATVDQPAGLQEPTIPPNSTLVGAFNITFQDIRERSDQFALNLKIPFTQWTGDEGFIKFGYFNDRTRRKFKQDTFFNPNDTDFKLEAPFTGPFLSEAFNDPDQFRGNIDTPRFFERFGLAFDQPGPLEASDLDVSYTGQQKIEAWYWMVDMPLNSYVSMSGGMRLESTQLKTRVVPDDPAKTVVFFVDEPGPASLFQNGINRGNVDFAQDDALPAVSFRITPNDELTFRGSYTETVARQTFRELTPVRQAEFFGARPFVGNPMLEMSAVRNYDLRVDYQPYAGGLFSVSYFRKDVEDPIEVVQQVKGGTTINIPVNFSEGQLFGWEFEARQKMGEVWKPLRGLTLGANATLIDSEVIVPNDPNDPASLGQQLLSINSFRPKREMVNTPEFLYNLFLNYQIEESGTEFSLTYTVQGDTLIAGAGVDKNKFLIPDIYREGFGTLTFKVSQEIGDHIEISFKADNLTNPEIREVYRSDFTQSAVRRSYTEGIDLSLSVTANFDF